MTQKQNESVAASGGIGLGGALGVLFVALKLCGVIHWSWLWVLAPFWMPVVFVVGVFLTALLIAAVYGAFK